MATPDDKKETAAEKEQQNDGNPVVEDKAEKAGKGKMKKLLIIILAVVLLTAASTFFAISFFKEDLPASVEGEGNTEADGEESTVNKREPVKATLALEKFLVNLADKEEVRFVNAAGE